MKNFATKLYVGSGLALMAALATVAPAHAQIDASAIDAAEAGVTDTVGDMTPFVVAVGVVFLGIAGLVWLFKVAYRSIKGGKVAA